MLRRAMLQSLQIGMKFGGKRSSAATLWMSRSASSSVQSTGTISGTIPYMGQGVAIGQYAEVERCFSKQDVQVFGDLAHDNNILHSSVNWKEALTEMPHLEAIKDSGLIRMEEEKNATKSMTKPLVHGILVSSLFSSIFGTLSPGCVYMNQTLQFANPVFVDDLVLARLEIEKIRNWRRGGLVVQCNTTVSVASTETPRIFDKKAVTGMANVWLPSGHQ